VYGADPSLIRARRSKNTYGVRTCGPHTEGAPSRFWHAEEGCFYTDSLFHTFVTRNEEVWLTGNHWGLQLVQCSANQVLPVS
jgi:hypothetical protein